MLAAEARKLDLGVVVLDPNPDAPARSLCDEFLCGSFAQADSVRELVRQVDVTTIEIEHVDVDTLADLEAAGNPIYPSPGTLRIIQDKLVQKQRLADADIPVPPFVELPHVGDVVAAARRFGLPAVQKTRFGGYDGRGVMVLQADADEANLLPGPTMLEELVLIREEISVIVARSVDGRIRSYPPCRMVFDPAGNICTRVELPAWPSAGQGSALEAGARNLAEAAAECFQIVGLLAVEMFVTTDGRLLVNEIAPRPHNSGHLTIEACVTSQFEQHVRAVCGLPLGSTRAVTPAIMLNLLGTGVAGPTRVSGLDAALELDGVTAHLYGKKQSRPLRKMGHVTIVGEDIAECRRTANGVESLLVIDGDG